MELLEAITDRATNQVDGENDWYTWSVNEDLLPENVSLTQGNSYSKNVSLKLRLNSEWVAANGTGDTSRKLELESYYVSTWGGVRANKPATLQRYCDLNADDLVALGSHGIASWSKILCVRDPLRYAIYDARISAALNSLQIIYNSSDSILFPIIPSRNNVIKQGFPLIRKQADARGWKRSKSFYSKYLRLIGGTAESIGSVAPYTIEMFLFANAQQLVTEAFDL